MNPLPAEIQFRGLRGRIIAFLLQLPLVRFHRLQRGFAQQPQLYRTFLATLVHERLRPLTGALGIFGCGEHTRLLLEAIPELAERVHCYTDNNAALWHQQRFGRPVLPPAEAARVCSAVILSTVVFQSAMRRDLLRLGFRGTIIAMDDRLPPAWFLEH
jgi:signal transduction histidine kinase